MNPQDRPTGAVAVSVRVLLPLPLTLSLFGKRSQGRRRCKNRYFTSGRAKLIPRQNERTTEEPYVIQGRRRKAYISAQTACRPAAAGAA